MLLLLYSKQYPSLPEDAEESVNDTYMAAWNAMLPSKPSILSTFLEKLTRRISIDCWRNLSADKRGGGTVTMALDELAECIPSGSDLVAEVEQLMVEHGFKPYSGEWWHFSDTTSFPVEQSFEPTAPSWDYADCNEFISLRTEPNTSADVITKIQAKEEFQVLALHGDFVLVEYQNLLCYVLRSYILPVE